MPYRNRAYDIYRKNFSEASAVGFLSAILFTVFCEPVKNLVDFGEKWMELSGLPYQMNIALLGFVVGYGTVRILKLMRIQIFRMLLNYQGWMFNPKSTTTKVGYQSLNKSFRVVSAQSSTLGRFGLLFQPGLFWPWVVSANLLGHFGLIFFNL